MLRRFLYPSVGALALLAGLAAPGQLHAQHMHGGGPRGGRTDEQAHAREHDHAAITPAHELARREHAAVHGLVLGRQNLNLQAGGRMVGIVTHVDELKEEFTGRIVVRKEEGTSRVEVRSLA